MTIGCGDACQVILGKRYLDWELEDPAGKGLPEVLVIRDEIASRVDTPVSEFEGSPDL